MQKVLVMERSRFLKYKNLTQNHLEIKNKIK